MPQARQHSLNEASIPIPENLFGQLAQAEPKDAVEIARKLPLENRAHLAAFCYGKRHLNHLGLLLAATCDRMSLRRTMGNAGDIVFQQSRDIEKTLGEQARDRQARTKVTLATAANIVPLRPIVADYDVEDDETPERAG
ncbi:MAG: hypothetical protein OXR62_10040 [Ahrensia sp.]|nr:hypothetical protein [Ahrensia sp.]